jgi:predicted 2-oxoglutarate/Fe(II)-dependent dioxygenase YbiX
VIFSCTLLHEALPVTQGQRFGLFTFFTDAQGLAAQKAAQQRSRAAGKSGVVVS